MENKINLYDSINTTAVRWLMNLAKTSDRPLCFFNLNSQDPSHLWLLNMADAFSVYNNYCDYYVDCGIFTYMYLRYIKKHKHLRYYMRCDICEIKTTVFIRDILYAFDITKRDIIDLYELFWGKK